MLLKNYMVSGWRNIVKSKLFSAINILGLAIGLAAVMMITIYVRGELSYDKFWAKADQIYRPDITFSVPGRDPMNLPGTPGIMKASMQKDHPQIEHITRIGFTGPTVVIDGTTFTDRVALVDVDFPEVFDLNVTQGNIFDTFRDPNSIALSQELATKYFGEANPIGQVLPYSFTGFQRNMKVTAVFEDLPDNTVLSLPALMLINEDDWVNRPWMFANWYSVNTALFFTLAEGTDPSSIVENYPAYINRNFTDFPLGGPDAIISDYIELGLKNIKDLYLKDVSFGGDSRGGSMTSVITFTAIAILILIIASINFMNLSTARASQRAREVSMRKVVGASRKQLIGQFLGESVLITLFGLIIALALVEVLLPSFGELVGKELTLDYSSSDMLQVIGLTLFVGLVGGIYPAFVLSNFRPASVLKANQSTETSASAKMRTVLVVCQFAVTIGLFISTGVIYAQTQFAKTMNPGFNKENVLVINRAGRTDTSGYQEDIMNTLAARSDIFTSVSSADTSPGRSQSNNNIARTADMAAGEEVLIGERRVNYDFFKTLEIPVLAGRVYDRDRGDRSPSDEALAEDPSLTGKVVLNESALPKFGWGSPEEAVGEYIFIMTGSDQSNPLQLGLEIIGVVPDMNFDSLKQTIRPEMYRLYNHPGFYNVILARFNGDPDQAREVAKEIWEERIADISFSSAFVDELMARQYRTEEAEAIMLASFSGLAIIIACLGLFGLASFTAERRTKEIGIRKVMGARIRDIVKLMLWQFSKPVAIANIIAWPLAFYAMSDWLEQFVYRIDFLWIAALCLVAGLAALLIAWGTVASNAVRVAKTNPIKALRYE